MHVGQAHIEQEGPSTGAETEDPRGNSPQASLGLSSVSAVLPCLGEKPQNTCPTGSGSARVYNLLRKCGESLVSHLKAKNNYTNHCCPLTFTESLLNVTHIV